MPLSEAEIELRLKRFKADLKHSSGDVVHQHLLSGLPAVIDESDYFVLRRRVAQNLRVTAAEVLLVGSCRIGFSVVDKTEKSNRPRYSYCHPGSDLDLTIVSTQLFTQVWGEVRQYADGNRAWDTGGGGDDFRKALFEGWVDPKLLIAARAVTFFKTWDALQAQIRREGKYGNRHLSLRVYKDWERLTRFQQIAVEQCQREAK